MNVEPLRDNRALPDRALLDRALPVSIADVGRAREVSRIATHESGHAAVAWLVGKSRKLEVLSIIKRSAALGLLAHFDREERFTQTESEMRALIEIGLGGLVAEQHFFGERSSGVSGDLKQVTKLAAQMVGAMGMGGTLVSFEAVKAGGTTWWRRCCRPTKGARPWPACSRRPGPR
jgi:ATP-dependent Zn protease